MKSGDQRGSTKLVLFEIGSNGRIPTVKRVDLPGSDSLTTRDVPMPLVRNLMSLHESAAPGTVKGFAKSVFQFGLMEELMNDVIRPKNDLSSPRSRVDLKNPEQLLEAFYASSYLQNEEARECLVYSQEGKAVGMAQIGKFGSDIEGLQCTISNLLVSPNLDAPTQGVIVRHAAQTAQEQFGEATLLTPEPWGSSYVSHGFLMEHAGPQSPLEESEEASRRDPIGVSILRGSGTSVPRMKKSKQQNIVRCRYT